MEPIGPYKVLAEVARGGAGRVCRAVAPDGRHVALKLLLAGKHATPLQRRRATTEIRALQRLRHEHVVSLLDAGEHQGVPYAVLEWVDGESLGARLRRDGPLKPVWAVELVRRLCMAVEHGHAQGVLHRDIKPDNVMIRAADGEPLLADFGLGKDLLESLGASSARTVADQWLGTPGWWPPEQARGQLGAIGPRSDVYGLGALLYATLTGEQPQEGETLPELVRAAERPPVPPSRVRPGLPPWLDALCVRALDPDPARRPASAGELAALLERGAKGALSLNEARGIAGTRRSLLPALVVAVALTGAAAAVVAVLVREPGIDLTARDAAIDRGAALMKLERWAEGLIECERALAIDPDLAVAHHDRGVALGELGRKEEALLALSRAIELVPGQGQPWAARGVILSELGRHEEALADCDRAVALAPGDAAAHSDRATVLSRLARWREAIAGFDAALEIDPLNPAWLRRRGQARGKAGELEPALADYDRALALAPDDGPLHSDRGGALAALGRSDEALAAYERAIALAPEYALAWANRARELANRGRWEEAIADCDRAIALDPRCAGAYVNRAAARGNLGRYEAAMADFDRALELEPQAEWAEQLRAEREKARALLAR